MVKQEQIMHWSTMGLKPCPRWCTQICALQAARNNELTTGGFNFYRLYKMQHNVLQQYLLQLCAYCHSTLKH